MAGVTLPDMRPWGRQPLTIPPNSLNAWMRLAIWELWMGALVAFTLGFGLFLIATSPSHIVTLTDLNGCYGPPPVTLPCERVFYAGGMLNTAFTALCGLMLVGVAAWFVWEVWFAVEPKPITDDFLRLLNDSFGRDWRNPLKWPWTRLFYAYGFTIVGATLTAAVVLSVVTWVATAAPHKPARVHVGTSQSFRVGQ